MSEVSTILTIEIHDGYPDSTGVMGNLLHLENFSHLHR